MYVFLQIFSDNSDIILCFVFNLSYQHFQGFQKMVQAILEKPAMSSNCIHSYDPTTTCRNGRPFANDWPQKSSPSPFCFSYTQLTRTLISSQGLRHDIHVIVCNYEEIILYLLVFKNLKKKIHLFLNFNPADKNPLNTIQALNCLEYY